MTLYAQYPRKSLKTTLRRLINENQFEELFWMATNRQQSKLSLSMVFPMKLMLKN
jgi:hypothetical protein